MLELRTRKGEHRALWLVQALSGLWLPHLYRDAGWITATWYGNDWVTLALACPLLFAALSGGRRDLPRWQVVRVGLVGYSVDNSPSTCSARP